MTIDLGGVGPMTAGLLPAVTQYADAARSVGGRVRVVVPPDDPASAVAWETLGDAVDLIG